MSEGVSDIVVVGVYEGVTELVGVIDGVGVTEFVVVNEVLTELVYVFDGVGVLDDPGVSDGVGVS